VVDRVLCRVAGLPGVRVCGHYVWPVPLAGIGVQAVAPQVGVSLPVLVPVVAAAVVVAAHAETVGSCGRCRQRLTVPGDVEVLHARAARQEWQLQLVHVPWASLPFWSLTISAVALELGGGWVGQVLSGVPIAVLWTLATRTVPRAHLQLQAACPWCHSGQDDDSGHDGDGGGGGGGGGGSDPQPPAPGGRGVPDDEIAGSWVPDTAEDLVARWASTSPAADPHGRPLPRPVVPVQRRGGAR
jgi:hypothetical protein